MEKDVRHFLIVQENKSVREKNRKTLTEKNMKKKLLIAATILTLAIIASLGINFNIGKTTTTISIKNVEALARGEGSGSNVCNGPKHVITYQCRSMNQSLCHDNSGC